MKAWMPRPVLMSALLAVATFTWMDRGEGVGAAMILQDSELQTAESTCTPPENCRMVAGSFLTHWISRTNSGNLFLVMETNCTDASRCSSWIVERTGRGVGMRLNIEGQFRVLNSGKPIPDIQTRRDLSETESTYTRYTWVAGAFLKAETRTVYRVNGVECGTALECYQTAVEAHQKRMTDKALRIWETVHKVSVI